jgi:TolB-like protein/Tfp pilus assembly protein PilF
LPGTGEIRSLAVLPLANLSGDPNQDYFVDGVTEQLIGNLAQINALSVVSRTTAMRYKDTELSLREIGRELGVDAIIEGSVIQSGDRVLISTKLIEADTDRLLLVEDYEAELEDILTLQQRFAKAVAGSIRIKLTPQEQERLTHARPVSPEAYQLHSYGRFFWNKRTEASLKTGLEYFQRAVEADSNYAQAYVGEADCYNLFERYGVLSPREAFPQARAASEKALSIDEQIGEAHASLAFTLFLYNWDWGASERAFKRALELSPGYATAHHWYSVYLRAMGRLGEAVNEACIARDLDPLSSIINTNLGDTYYFAREYQKAADQYALTLEFEEFFNPALYGLAYTNSALNRTDQAIAAIEAARKTAEQDVRGIITHAYALAVAGRNSEAIGILEQLDLERKQGFVSPAQIAVVHTALNDHDNAFDCLMHAYEHRDAELVYLAVDPRFDPIRSDPRFRDLVQKVGL